MKRRSRTAWIAGAVLALGAICAIAFPYLSALARVDYANASNFDEQTKSVDLDADLRLMWQTTPLRSGDGEASTLEAILAASRVFNTVSLVGKTGAETKALLGSNLRSSRSIYAAAPFWPLRERGLVYRFDCGSFGWQFNVYCKGDDAPVTEVERLWIH